MLDKIVGIPMASVCIFPFSKHVQNISHQCAMPLVFVISFACAKLEMERCSYSSRCTVSVPEVVDIKKDMKADLVHHGLSFKCLHETS